MRRKSSWQRQILNIQDKGYRAFLDGKPHTDNPYKFDGFNRGGSVQLQRHRAWRDGWDLAKRESK